MSEWRTQEEYVALYGSQEEQAARQSRVALCVDGPWLLYRFVSDKLVALDNSVRSTSREILWLQEQELNRTGIKWLVQLVSSFEKSSGAQGR